MVAAIRPCALTPALEAAATRFAERAAGLPGRFASLLWRQRLDAREAGRSAVRGRRVAEQVPVYGGEEAAHELLVATPPTEICSWPMPGELATLRRKRDAAVMDLAHGRHAPGLRQLRQAIGGLARRGDWAGACDGALALAGAVAAPGADPRRAGCDRRGTRLQPACRQRLLARRFRHPQRRGVDRSRAAGRSRERARQRARGCSLGGGRGALRIGVAGACPLPLLARPLRRCCGRAGRSGRSSPARAHDPAPPAGGASCDWPRRSDAGDAVGARSARDRVAGRRRPWTRCRLLNQRVRPPRRRRSGRRRARRR